MKKYIITSLSLLFAVGAYAQKDEIKNIKKILNKKAPTEADYRELQGIIDATTPYIANGTTSEQAEFYFHKGSYEFEKAKLTNNVDALSSAVESFNKVIKAEETEKRQPFTEKLKKETFPTFIGHAFMKAVEFSKLKKFREATDIFKSLYELNKDPLNLYYAASTAVSVPDYNTALEYYQELVDMDFTGEFDFYTAKNKSTGEVENFGDNKSLMDAAVKSGEYTHPKKEKETSKKPEILKNMVLIYLNVNQKSRAEKLLADARAESPNDTQLMLIQANFYYQDKELDKYEKLIQEVIAKDPENPELYYNLGVTNTEIGNTEKAKEYYQKAIKLNPKYTDAHINLGALALADEPSIIEQMNAITGFSAAENKKYEDLKNKRNELLKSAIPHFERALAVDPSNQFAISNLVNIFGALEMEAKEKEYRAKLKN